MYNQKYKSPIGELNIIANDDYLLSIAFSGENNKDEINGNIHTNNTITQLEEYFMGKRKVFDLPIKLNGTVFQMKVWNVLQNIPYGETRSYKDIAVLINSNNAQRGVGQANKANPYLIIVPCHRVIKSDGKIGGYAGNNENKIDIKRTLLELERKTRNGKN